MARAYFKCAECNDDVCVIERNRSEADKKAAWHEKEEHICSDCQKKQWEEENRKAVENSKNSGLPQLIGSEKQIAWASKIRLQSIERINESVKKILSNPHESYFCSKLVEKYGEEIAKQVMTEYYDAVNMLTEDIKNETSSKKWIDDYRGNLFDINYFRGKINDQLEILCPTLAKLIEDH